MKRIAGELGVSITTVSKVLNNHDDISPATRARVMAKVEELGYRPNAVARSLTLRRTHTLGIVIPDLMHSFFVEVVAGIEPVASERGYGLLLCSSGENSAKERSELQLLHGRQVDGIILAPSQGIGNAEVLQDLHAHGTGLVMIDRDDYPSVPCHRVLTDDEQVGTLATEHLLSAGRRAIGHLSGPRLTHARRREKGWKDALRAAGVRVPADWLVQGGFMESDGYTRDEAAAVGAAAHRCGVRGQRSVGDRRDEGHLGGRDENPRRHRRRRRGRRHPWGSAARAADDRRLVAHGPGTRGRRAAAGRVRTARRPTTKGHHSAAPGGQGIVRGRGDQG